MNKHKREPNTEPAPKQDELDEDLDLDVEESNDGDRLKEGFTGQER